MKIKETDKKFITNCYWLLGTNSGLNLKDSQRLLDLTVDLIEYIESSAFNIDTKRTCINCCNIKEFKTDFKCSLNSMKIENVHNHSCNVFMTESEFKQKYKGD